MNQRPTICRTGVPADEPIPYLQADGGLVTVTFAQLDRMSQAECRRLDKCEELFMRNAAGKKFVERWCHVTIERARSGL